MAEDSEQGVQRRRAAEQLGILEAMVLAMERRHEVFAVVESAADTDHAITRLRELLGIGIYTRVRS